MAGLAKLPAGCFYVANKGEHLMDHHGNVYAPVSTPHVSIPTPEKVKDWRDGLPRVMLSPDAVAHIKALREAMSYQPTEYFASVGIDICGDPCFEDIQEGDQVHCAVDYDRIITKAKEAKAVGVACYHNHPYPHPATMSEPDKQVTATLERKLAKEYITLHEHVVVKGRQVDAMASEMDYPTEWHKRQAEFEYQQAHEPHWLQQIREGLERRYVR